MKDKRKRPRPVKIVVLDKEAMLRNISHSIAKQIVERLTS